MGGGKEVAYRRFLLCYFFFVIWEFFLRFFLFCPIFFDHRKKIGSSGGGERGGARNVKMYVDVKGYFLGILAQLTPRARLLMLAPSSSARFALERSPLAAASPRSRYITSHPTHAETNKHTNKEQKKNEKLKMLHKSPAKNETKKSNNKKNTDFGENALWMDERGSVDSMDTPQPSYIT